MEQTVILLPILMQVGNPASCIQQVLLVKLLTSAGAGHNPLLVLLTTGFATNPDTCKRQHQVHQKVFGSIPSGTKMIVINYFDISSNNAGTTGALRLGFKDDGGGP